MGPDPRVRLREETDVKKTRFSEEQIIAVLREQEGGMKTADVCRKHGISSATLYAWKTMFAGVLADPGSLAGLVA
jgi:transposase-like protein